MGSFKDPDFVERRKAAVQARGAALEKFRAVTADPAFAQRQTEREAHAIARAAARKAREAERAERAKQAEREAAEQAERALAEKTSRELALEVERKAARDARYAARKARSKRR